MDVMDFGSLPFLGAWKQVVFYVTRSGDVSHLLSRVEEFHLLHHSHHSLGFQRHRLVPLTAQLVSGMPTR